MNTPAHAVINLFALGRNADNRQIVAIVGDALIPDLVLLVFYAWHLYLDTPEQQIWEINYYDAGWQLWIDSFNSIPIMMLATLLCWHLRHLVLAAFFASMLLHCLTDLPLHHDDAHRHFLPLSEWRFASPVSYWDPNHHGRWASLVEFSTVLAVAGLMIWRWPLLRGWLVALVTIYLGYWLYLYLVWM